VASVGGNRAVEVSGNQKHEIGGSVNTVVGGMMGVVVARGTFKLTRGGPLRLVDEQYPLVMSDTYDGDPHETPQLACTDLAPFKPGTDITFIGASFAPGGESQSSWRVSFTIRLQDVK
jgi:hypothetical protein